MDGITVSIVTTPGMHGLCKFFLQISQKDYNPARISDYRNPVLAKCQAIQDHTYKAYLVVSVLLILDH